jgi:hypothetical protein
MAQVDFVGHGLNQLPFPAQVCAEMKIAVMTGLFTERNVKVEMHFCQSRCREPAIATTS